MAQKRLPTFSGIGRAMACRASCVLAQADHVSDEAESGTAMHSFLERVAALRAEGKVAEEAAAVALTEAPEDEQPFLASIPVEELPTDPKAFAAEVALAFDAATGKCREIGRGLARNYGEVAPTEFVGTVDIAALMDSDGVFVADWKKRGRYVRAARDNWQIRAGLVAAAGAWGRTRGRGSIIRIYEDGDVYRDRGDLSAPDLEQARYELTMLAVSIVKDRAAYSRGEQIPATTGSHCRYCPSFQFCPANLTLARRMAAEPQAVQIELEALVTRETAPQVVRALAQAKAIVKAIEDAIDSLASQAAADGQPLEMGDGTVYAPIPRQRESIDGELAAPILRAELGEHASVAIALDVTKAGIKKAIGRKLNGARGVSKIEADVIEKLRKAGAVKRSVSYSCDITTPKALEAKGKREAA